MRGLSTVSHRGNRAGTKQCGPGGGGLVSGEAPSAVWLGLPASQPLQYDGFVPPGTCATSRPYGTLACQRNALVSLS